MALQNKKLFRKLKKPYRLSILNENTLEEKISIVLTPLNILLLFSTFIVVFFFLTYALINYSSIGNYIPSGNTANSKSTLINMQKELDEIANSHKIELKRRNDIIKILSGKTSELDTIDAKEFDKNANVEEINQKSPVIKQSIRQESSTIYVQNDLNFESLLFFTPIKGKISQGFDPAKHPAVDITPIIKDEAVRATLEGTIIFTSWTSDFGHVIQIQHSNNLISIYKHNSYLLKKMGDFVKTGEVIAFAGNTGELSDGVHLHFELWFNGRPLDPQKFISF